MRNSMTDVILRGLRKSVDRLVENEPGDFLRFDAVGFETGPIAGQLDERHTLNMKSISVISSTVVKLTSTSQVSYQV